MLAGVYDAESDSYIELTHIFPSFPDSSLDNVETSYVYSKFVYKCKQVTTLVYPLTLSFLVIFVIVKFFKMSICGGFPLGNLLSENEICCVFCVNTIISSLILISGVIVLTYLFMLAYTSRNLSSMHIICAIFYGSPVALLSLFFSIEIARLSNIPIDVFTIALIMWNIQIILPYIIISERFERCIENSITLLCSVATTWILISLSEGVVWGFCVLMVLWDIFAVYHPCGPLGIIIRTRQHWIYMAGTNVDIMYVYVYIYIYA
jgi:hypothetical protein